nr:TlpA disulfide reductase family protein [uncultured Anaeromusa sp.]
MKARSTIIKMLFLTCCFLVALTAACAASGANAGDKWTSRDLPLLDGTPVTLAPEKDKILVLNFFATWCPYCVRELPEFNQVYLKYQDKIKMYVIDMWETPDKANAFMYQNGYQIPTLFDNTGKSLANDLGIHGIPVTLIIDEEGTIRIRKDGMMPPGYLEKAIQQVLRKNEAAK